jgi:hypothetical protein
MSNGGIMYKLIYLITIFLFCSSAAFSADLKTPPAKPKPAPTFQEQMKNLENQRRMLSMKMYQLRIKLISEDSDLLMMHNQIMKLHKKLAIELNNNDNMKELISQSKDIDKKIIQLMQPESKKKTASSKKEISKEKQNEQPKIDKKDGK